MKRIVSILLFLSIVSFGVFSQADNSSDTFVKIKTGDLTTSNFNKFMVDFIGANITVYISNLDVTINGKLVSVYSDGILLQPLFKQKVFIFASSIAFLEVKGHSKKRK